MSEIRTDTSQAKERLKQSFNFASTTIIAIDHNALSLDVLTSMLSGFGFRKLFRFQELKPGTEFIKTHAVDLVIIDPAHYGSGGFNLIDWMRSDKTGLNKDVPVIVVAGHTTVRFITSTRQCGADYVIAKPFSTAALLERILWVAGQGQRRTDLNGPSNLVSSSGSGVEMW